MNLFSNFSVESFSIDSFKIASFFQSVAIASSISNKLFLFIHSFILSKSVLEKSLQSLFLNLDFNNLMRMSLFFIKLTQDNSASLRKSLGSTLFGSKPSPISYK